MRSDTCAESSAEPGPMKVTFVAAPLNHAGGTRVIVRYADGLTRRGHQVRIVTPANPPPPSAARRLYALLRRQPVGDPSGDRIFRPQEERTRLLVLDSSRPVEDRDVPESDVVVATWWETSYWVARLPRSKGAKAYFMQDYGAPGQELRDLVPTWSLPLHIITISRWCADLIREHSGKDTPVSLVPNAADERLFSMPPRKKPDQPVVGFVHRSSPMKGWDIVQEAIRLARQTIPELALVVFGPEDLGRIEPPAGGMRYVHRPADDQLASLYGQCTAWLFASRREGFGLPILEAMACRTPVIATPAGAAPELIGAGGGWLVEPEDASDMARAIVEVCRLSDERWQQASEAAHRAATSYTLEDSIQLFERALETAIERSSALDYPR